MYRIPSFSFMFGIVVEHLCNFVSPNTHTHIHTRQKKDGQEHPGAGKAHQLPRKPHVLFDFGLL